MNPVAKLETVLELYNKGLLCKCEEVEDDTLALEDRVVKHEENCTAKDQVSELLGFNVDREDDDYWLP